LLHDIYNLDLPADLLVLSACESLVGLKRGFMYAGAAQVLVSLWKVDDEATAELMRLFYRGMLVNSQSPATASQNAQTARRKQRR
jgi:CHAT domain-containing protein